MATSARIDELLKKFDENPRRYFAPLANEYRKAGDPQRAVGICEEYLPQQPGHMSGHIVYGQALFELGRHEDARQVFETALSLDPENLIALRHLGDIARAAGDAHSARVWYQRVLEADPRNEEIAELMMSLLSTPVGTAAVEQRPPTPLSAPVISEESAGPSSNAAEPQMGEAVAGANGVESTVAPEHHLDVSEEVVTPQSFVSRHAPKEDELLDLDSFDIGGVPLSALRDAKEPEADAASDAPFEPSSFASSSESSLEQPFEPPFEASPVAAETFEIEKAQEGERFEQNEEDTFEADAFAIAAKPLQEGDTGSMEEDPPGTIELAADIDLGLPDDGGASSTFPAGEEMVDGLESFEPGIIAGVSSAISSPDVLPSESFYEISDTDALAAPPPPPLATPKFHEAQPASLQGDPLLTPAFGSLAANADSESDASAADEFVADEIALEPTVTDELATADSAEAAAYVPSADVPPTDELSTDEPTPEPSAFVNTTMAELYLEQGHYDDAIEIYRKLVEQRPDDIALRDRLHAAEERAWGHQRDVGASILDESDVTTAIGVADEEAIPAPRSYGGPTIRDFLTDIFFRRNAIAVEETALPEVTDEPSPLEAHEETLQDDIATTAEVPPPSRATPSQSSGDSVTGSLDALFSASDAAASSAEEGERGTIEGRVATPIGGTPAHRAPTELSLDHVFKANTARATGDQAFSFDQFFSGDAEEQTAPSPEPAAESRVESSDDIAQFNAWLNGLKKS